MGGVGETLVKEIEDKRANAKPIIIDPTRTYRKICPACNKPNALSVNYCSGCGFPLTDADIQRVSDNIFLDMIKGLDTGTVVLKRTKKVLVFDDKFPISTHHIDVIPTQVIPDISYLGSAHISLIKILYQYGLEELRLRNITVEGPLEDYIFAGFNFPVSVNHLHLHMTVPPFKHKKIFQYPRWHPYEKVLSDLETYGKVLTLDLYPNKELGKEFYDHAMQVHEALVDYIL